MSIASRLRKLMGVSLSFLGAVQAQADQRRGMPQRPYKGTLFEEAFGTSPAEMSTANAARRRRIGNCFSQRRADAKALKAAGY